MKECLRVLGKIMGVGMVLVFFQRVGTGNLRLILTWKKMSPQKMFKNQYSLHYLVEKRSSLEDIKYMNRISLV